MSEPLDTLPVGPYRVEVYRERMEIVGRDGARVPSEELLRSLDGLRALRYAFEAADAVAAEAYDKHLRGLASIHRDLRTYAPGGFEWRYRLLLETEEQLGNAALAVREARAALDAITGELGFARAPADYPDGYEARRGAARAALEAAIAGMYDRLR